MAKNLNIQKLTPIDTLESIIMGAEEPKQEQATAQTEEKPSTTETVDKGKAKIMTFQCYPEDKDRYKTYAYEHNIKLTEFFRRSTADYMANHPDGVPANIKPSEKGKGAVLMSFQVYEADLKTIRDYAFYNKTTVTELIRLATAEYMRLHS